MCKDTGLLKVGKGCWFTRTPAPLWRSLGSAWKRYSLPCLIVGEKGESFPHYTVWREVFVSASFGYSRTFYLVCWYLAHAESRLYADSTAARQQLRQATIELPSHCSPLLYHPIKNKCKQNKTLKIVAADCVNASHCHFSHRHSLEW
eukprot:1207427-Amphidinium_carterae.4